MSNIVIIDGNNLLCRHYFVRRGLRDPQGETVSGILGMMESLNTYASIFGKTQLVVVWDGERDKKRLALYPDYKKQREDSMTAANKPDILRQRDRAMRIIDSMPVAQILIDDMEADDVIAVICASYAGKKTIVSSDHDFIQLIEEDVHLHLVSKDITLTPDNVDGFLGFPHSKYTIWKSLVGDKSDNIKGVHGIGPVKATKAILENAIKPEWRDTIRLNKMILIPGYFVSEEQNYKIIDQMAIQTAKKLKLGEVKREFMNLNFRLLLQSMPDWSRPFVSA
jgi:DNA polymerase-1